VAKTVDIYADTVTIDSLSIYPPSFFLFYADNTLVPDSLYELQGGEGKLIAPMLKGQRCSARYRTFSENLSAPYFHKDRNRFLFDTVLDNPTAQSYSLAMDPQYSSESGVQTSGSISRGISVGNNQDLIMNSSMNLQMHGYVTNNVQLEAAVLKKGGCFFRLAYLRLSGYTDINMNVIEQLQDAGHPLISVEFFPPKTEAGRTAFHQTATELLKLVLNFPLLMLKEYMFIGSHITICGTQNSAIPLL